MKIITIRLPDVEAAMLAEVQKRNKAFRDIGAMLLQNTKDEYARIHFQ